VTRAALFAAVIACASCGRVGFDAVGDGDVAGVTPTVLVDFTNIVPYVGSDFVDDDGTVLDNSPHGLAALTAPFSVGFAVAAGREVIEIPLTGSAVAHDYRPATAGSSGPDEIVELTQADLPDTGPALWAAGESLLDGDGLYALGSDWSITRDNPANNVAGLAYDPTGAFDGLGTPQLYFTAGNEGAYRRLGAGSGSALYDSADTLGTVALTATSLDAIDYDGTQTGPTRAVMIAPGAHAASSFDTPVDVRFATGDADTGAGILAVRGGAQVVIYQPDGTYSVVATSDDPAKQWRDVTVPRAPHPLAGRRIVLEWTPSPPRSRLLLLPP
jgi:hypothetical protein